VTATATVRCHAPGCTKLVPLAKFGCTSHWFALSRPVRDAIKRTASLPLTHRDRREAVKAAIREWREPTRPTAPEAA
jgi:hypothetical protein